MGAVNLGTLGGSPMLDAAQGVLQSSLPVPIVSTANVTLIGENTVLVKDNIHLPGNMYLRCVLEADSEFSHLAPASVLAFSKLVEYATKAYIYNNLIVEIDYAELSGGMALGRLKEIVEGYSDANELYETHFNEVWRKVAIFNDFEAHRRHLKMVLGGRW